MELSQASSDFVVRDVGGFAGQVEILEGPTGRRQWPDEVKGGIVRESFDGGAGVNDVARRHRISPQRLTGWRRAARQGRLVLPLEDDSPDFVPVVIEPDGLACPCGCGDMVKIGEDVSERLDIVPAQLRVLGPIDIHLSQIIAAARWTKPEKWIVRRS